MNPQANPSLNSRYSLPLLFLLVAIGLSVFNFLSAAKVLESKQEFDRQSLLQLFAEHDFDNDLLLSSFVLSPPSDGATYINVDLLGLRRERLAYIARDAGQVVAIAVPATAEDGFNGFVDLLISVDMYGRISAARVIEDVDSNELFGVVDVIESQWMKKFSGNSMRDILKTSWQSIPPDNEFDQFVGASITPKTVSNRIYDSLVFFQSNRIALMQGDAQFRGD